MEYPTKFSRNAKFEVKAKHGLKLGVWDDFRFGRRTGSLRTAFVIHFLSVDVRHAALHRRSYVSRKIPPQEHMSLS